MGNHAPLTLESFSNREFCLQQEVTMNTPSGGLKLSSILFGLMALGQLWRLVAQPEVLMSGVPVPVWPSALAFILLLVLSIWLWRLSKRAS